MAAFVPHGDAYMDKKMFKNKSFFKNVYAGRVQ